MNITSAIANVNISSICSRKSVRLAREIVELSILKQLYLDSSSNSSSFKMSLISSTVEACLMLKRVESAEKNYLLYFEEIVDMAKSLSNSLSIQNGRETFREISRQLFNNNNNTRQQQQTLISWGRVVAMNIFTIILKTLREDNKLTLEFQNSIADWLGECLVEINSWMERQHVTRDGWISFVEESERHESMEESTILSVFSYYTNEAVKTSFNVCFFSFLNGC